MLTFLHGFLGCKEDWEEVISYLSFNPSSFSPNVLVGYSMGGRIALQWHRLFFQRWDLIIVIGGHPGLSCPQEREKVFQRDALWALKLKKTPFEEFLKEWYDQPLFASLKAKKEVYQTMIERRKKQDPLFWAETLLTLSTALLPPPFFSAKLCFLYGEGDVKYKSLYSLLPSFLPLYPIPCCGHAALLENPKETAKLISYCIERHVPFNHRF